MTGADGVSLPLEAIGADVLPFAGEAGEAGEDLVFSHGIYQREVGKKSRIRRMGRI